MRLQCGHVFDNTCIVDWHAAERQRHGVEVILHCPICRQAHEPEITSADRTFPEPPAREAYLMERRYRLERMREQYRADVLPPSWLIQSWSVPDYDGSMLDDWDEHEREVALFEAERIEQERSAAAAARHTSSSGGGYDNGGDDGGDWSDFGGGAADGGGVGDSW